MRVSVRGGIAAASAVLVVGLGAVLLGDDEVDVGARPTQGTPVSTKLAASSSNRPKLKQETKVALGSFRVGKNRTIHVSTGETVDGMGCLIEEEGESFASSCLDGGLFSLRRAELMVSSMGGPGRFDELRVVGVVAPSISAALLVKSDGTSARVELNDHRAFAYESPDIELEAGVLPTALRLIGKNGRVIETVDFPHGS